MYIDDSQIFELNCGKYFSDSEGYIQCKFEELNMSDEKSEKVENI